MSNWKQTPEWEKLFQTVINKAKTCPARSLFFSESITAERIDSAAGNHVFDDHYEFWGITKQEGHNLRAVFQTYSIRKDEDFKKYVQELIDNSMDINFKR